MKLSMTFYIALTTLLLVAVALMVFYELSLNLIFFTTLLGQFSLLFMVYKILTDDYQTDKTFEDWYEDKPIGRE